jgi:hypothetical protein
MLALLWFQKWHEFSECTTKDIKTNFRSEEVIFCMGKDKLPVLKNSDGIDFCTLWQLLNKLLKSIQPIFERQIVLD